MKEGFGFFELWRRRLTAVFGVLCLGFVIVTHHSWPDGGVIDRAFDIAGALCVAAGVLGRLWSTAYIGGRKNKDLVMDGPYSMTRNPLYFFSFLGGLGVFLAFQNIYIIAVYVVAFPLSYRYVIRSEEKRLAGLFGPEFDKYLESTPAFFPNVFKLKVGKIDSVAPGLIKRSLGDGSVFVLLLLVAYLIEHLQETGVLHVLWRVP